MFFIKEIVDDKCLVVDTEDEAEEWYYTKDIQTQFKNVFIMGRKGEAISKVTLQDLIKYRITLNKLSGTEFNNCGLIEEYIFLSEDKLEDSGFLSPEDVILGIKFKDNTASLMSKSKDLDYRIPYGVTHLSFMCFYFKNTNMHLDSVYVPSTMKKIGLYNFSNAIVSKVIFSDKSDLIEFEEFSFADAKVDEVKFPPQLERLGHRCFRRSTIKSLKLPSTMKYIGKSCFEDCEKLDFVSLSGNNLVIDCSAFVSCKNLRTIVIDGKCFRTYLSIE